MERLQLGFGGIDCQFGGAARLLPLLLKIGLPDAFCKNTGHFVNSDSSTSSLGCIRKRIFNGTGFSNLKNAFLTMHLFFMLFSLQFHETPTMVGLKMFQTVYKRKLCEHSL